MFLNFNFDGFVNLGCILNIVVNAIYAPNININGTNTGHITSEVFVIRCSNCIKTKSIFFSYTNNYLKFDLELI